MVDAKEYDVALLPDERLRALTIAASESLKPFGTLFTLDGERFYPHLSLYFGVRLREEALPKVQTALQKIAEGQAPLPLNASHFQQQRGYIGVHFERSSDVAALHQQVLEAINPLRLRDRPQTFKDTSNLQRANLERYGWDKAGELYEPHVTLSRFADRDVEHLNDLPSDVHDFNGTFPTLGLFELGPNGTCVRQIFAFALKA